jgi:hypothetical protein
MSDVKKTLLEVLLSPVSSEVEKQKAADALAKLDAPKPAAQAEPAMIPSELMFAVIENPNLTGDEAVALSGGSISKKRAEKWLKGCAESRKQTDEATKKYKDATTKLAAVIEKYIDAHFAGLPVPCGHPSKCQSWADCGYARCVRKNFAIDLDKEIYRARHGEGKWPSPEIEQLVTMQFAAISAGAAA